MNDKNSLIKLMGVIFILIGILLPWRCYTTFILGCDQLIYLDSLRSIFSDPARSVIYIVIIALMFLLLNTAGLNLTQTLLVFVSLFYSGVLFIKLPEYYQRGLYFLNNELLMLVLGALTTWLVLYSSFDKVRNAHRYLTASSLALALVSVVYIGQTLYTQYINIPLDGRVKLALGLPLITLGSLVIAISRQTIEFLGNKAAVQAEE